MGAIGNLICWGVLPVIVAIGGFYLQYTANVQKLLDLGKHVYNHYPGPCRVVEGINPFPLILSNGKEHNIASSLSDKKDSTWSIPRVGPS